jgi:hypothetical protein
MKVLALLVLADHRTNVLLVYYFKKAFLFVGRPSGWDISKIFHFTSPVWKVS